MTSSGEPVRVLSSALRRPSGHEVVAVGSRLVAGLAARAAEGLRRRRMTIRRQRCARDRARLRLLARRVGGARPRRASHVGRNSITDLYRHRALAEHWRGDRGVVGHSLTRGTPSAAAGTRPGWTPPVGVLLLDGAVAGRRRWCSRASTPTRGNGSPGPATATASASSGRPPRTTGRPGRRRSTARYRRA